MVYTEMSSVHLTGISWKVMNHFSFLLLSRLLSLSLTFSPSTMMQLFIKIQWLSLLWSYFDFIEHPRWTGYCSSINLRCLQPLFLQIFFSSFSLSLIFPLCICWCALYSPRFLWALIFFILYSLCSPACTTLSIFSSSRIPSPASSSLLLNSSSKFLNTQLRFCGKREAFTNLLQWLELRLGSR